MALGIPLGRVNLFCPGICRRSLPGRCVLWRTLWNFGGMAFCGAFQNNAAEGPASDILNTCGITIFL